MRQSKIFFTTWIFLLLPLCIYAEPNNGEIENSIISYEDALVFGLVEGITEFLPVSSTGHLILANEWMMDPSTLDYSQQEAINAYLIVIQAGAIFAVALLYARRIYIILLGFLGLNSMGRKLGFNLLAGFAPAAITGPFLDSWIESFLFGSLPVAIALILGAGLMYWAEKRKINQEKRGQVEGKNLEDLSIGDSIMVGLLQCVAMCPGTSRSMMTIIGGYLAGLSRGQSAEFSFLLGLVTLTAAAVYKGATKGNEILENLQFGPMFFGCLIAGVSAALSVRWLVGYLSKRGLGLFVWYRLFLGLFVLFYFWEF